MYHPTPYPVQFLVSISLDIGRIPDIIFGIMPDKSSAETSYIIHDAYYTIYSTMNRLLIEPTQEKVQSYHHHIESEERASASDAAHRDFTSELNIYSSPPHM